MPQCFQYPAAGKNALNKSCIMKQGALGASSHASLCSTSTYFGGTSREDSMAGQQAWIVQKQRWAHRTYCTKATSVPDWWHMWTWPVIPYVSTPASSYHHAKPPTLIVIKAKLNQCLPRPMHVAIFRRGKKCGSKQENTAYGL